MVIMSHQNTNSNLVRYTTVTNGSTCERVISKAECEVAARQLDLSDTVASEEYEVDYPLNCYIYNGKQLYFNTNSNSDARCNSNTVCICKDTSGKVEGR